MIQLDTNRIAARGTKRESSNRMASDSRGCASCGASEDAMTERFDLIQAGLLAVLANSLLIAIAAIWTVIL